MDDSNHWLIHYTCFILQIYFSSCEKDDSCIFPYICNKHGLINFLQSERYFQIINEAHSKSRVFNENFFCSKINIPTDSNQGLVYIHLCSMRLIISSTWDFLRIKVAVRIFSAFFGLLPPLSFHPSSICMQSFLSDVT